MASENPPCPKCGAESVLIDDRAIYRRHYGHAYQCPNHADHFVGAHKGSLRPKGTLAGPELRELRKACHRGFDQMWRGHGKKSRKAAYRWMAETLEIDEGEAHIGMFDEARCRRLLEVLGGP